MAIIKCSETKAKTIPEMLIVRGIDWIDCYHWPKQEGGAHA